MPDNSISPEKRKELEKRNALMVKGDVFKEAQARIIEKTTEGNFQALKGDDEQLMLLVEFFAKMDYMKSVVTETYVDGKREVTEGSFEFLGKFYLELSDEYTKKSQKLFEYNQSHNTSDHN